MWPNKKKLPGASSLPCYSSSSHMGAPGSRECGTQLWLCSQGRLQSWETLAQQAWSSSLSPAPEGGQAQASAPRKSRVSGGMAVACLKASLFLGIVQNVSCGFSSSLLFFLLTLPIRPSESPDSTGKQQMLTLLRASQRQRSPVEWGEGRKVRGRGMAEDNPSPFQTVREDVAAESERSQGPTQNNADSQGQGKKGALH